MRAISGSERESLRNAAGSSMRHSIVVCGKNDGTPFTSAGDPGSALAGNVGRPSHHRDERFLDLVE
jgi:hypothetical protein